jgi:glycosyltransferase involved in cell wall biosynthesis
MHVVFLPKWYPGRGDPQLGDFLRKQAMATGRMVQVSVMAPLPLRGADAWDGQEVDTADGIWELRCYYQASEHPLAAVRKAINLQRYRRAVNAGWDRLVREQGLPDLAHVHILLRPALVARWLERRHGIPYLVSEQSSGFLDGTFARKSSAYRALTRQLTRQARAVTAVSPWLGEALVRHRLCERFTVVPNVVPGLERPLPPPGPAGQFLMVADLVDRTKNVSGVLRALAEAHRSEARLRLTIIGDGPDRAELEKLAHDLDLGNSVVFLGRLPNHAVLDHMAHVGAVVINSNVETFSVVTGEALAQGKPVVATRCGGPEAFITPANGLLIPVGDDRALASAMLQITAGHARYVPHTIRDSVSDRYGPEAVGRAFVGLYETVLHGRE